MTPLAEARHGLTMNSVVVPLGCTPDAVQRGLTVSYTPDYPPQPTAAWPGQDPPTQVPGWGSPPPDQPYGPSPQAWAPQGPPRSPKTSPGLIIVLVLLAVAAVATGAFVLLSGDDDGETATDETTEQGNVGEDGSVTTLPNVDPPDPSDPSVTTPEQPQVPIGEVTADAGPPAAPPTGDAQFDDLADECFQGDMDACDELYQETPVGSDYEAYGDTCGARIDQSFGYYCTDLLPDPEPPAN
jgi:hypothetical protein